MSFLGITASNAPKKGGSSNAAPVGPTATGGTVTNISGYKVHTFTSSGNFVISGGSLAVEYLSIAGGGGASIGGGGAGGLLTSAAPVTLGSGTYAITIGAGGAGVPTRLDLEGGNGTESSIVGTGITVGCAAGGGGGSEIPTNGRGGGSGGGGGYDGQKSTGGGGSGVYPGSPFISAPRQGYDGGTAGGFSTSGSGGGGGGAGNLGGEINDSSSGSPYFGNGGPGVNSSINGTNTGYAGGGQGFSETGFGYAAQGGAGFYPVPGSPGSFAVQAPRVNSGGGGYINVSSGNGASGIVIIRYAV